MEPIGARLLSNKTVRLRDPAAVEAILKRLIEAGADKLQIITDFDYTVSKATRSCGTQNCTTHGIFDTVTNGVDPALQQRLRDLKTKYYPIEMDPLLPNEVKVPLMETWWNEAHVMISNAGFKRAVLEKYVKEANVEIRDACTDFVQCAEDAKIPVVIFSAGIGDLIEIIFRQRYGHIPPNLHIISNMMRFDETGTVVGFNDPLIHTFNKNRSVIKQEKEFFSHLRNRPNVLLLGDTLGDLSMDVGVVNEGTILKIGFLNQQVEKSLPPYLNGYDIVLVQDQTYDVPLNILKAIVGKSMEP